MARFKTAPARPPVSRSGWLHRAARLTGLLGAGCGLFLASIYWRQESLLFDPVPLPADHVFSQPDVREVRIEVDGASLSALHLKLPNPQGVVFFLHGNSGNLATWFTNAAFYRNANYDLFMIDYRGYGKSSGRIESQAQLRADVRQAWDWLAPQYAGKTRVIYGRSLGTALAAGLSADVPADLTVLVSPYCSMSDLMRANYPLLPTLLLRYPLPTCEYAARLHGPLLLVHGEADRVIPIAHSEKILALAPQAQLLRIPGAGHNDVHQFAVYIETLTRRLRAL